MDCSKMSDFEINKMVAIILGKDLMPDDCQDFGLSGFPEVMLRSGDYKDYCNNPEDAWPIIVGKKLSIINADDKWLCVPEDEPVNGVTGDAVHMIYYGDGAEHENPLRAAMIVFLMMQDSANVQDNTA